MMSYEAKKTGGGVDLGWIVFFLVLVLLVLVHKPTKGETRMPPVLLRSIALKGFKSTKTLGRAGSQIQGSHREAGGQSI